MGLERGLRFFLFHSIGSFALFVLLDFMIRLAETQILIHYIEMLPNIFFSIEACL